MPLLETIQKVVPQKIEEQTPTHEELLHQKSRIDYRLKLFERRDIDAKIISSLQKIRDVNDSVSDLQHSLNIVWKRTKQIEEELNEVLRQPFPKPSTLSPHQSPNPQQENHVL